MKIRVQKYAINLASDLYVYDAWLRLYNFLKLVEISVGANLPDPALLLFLANEPAKSRSKFA